MRVLGIDSGINGGCSLYESGDRLDVDMFDIPTVGEGKTREIDYAGLRDGIYRCAPDVVVIETVNAFMPTRENEHGEKEKVQWGGTSLFRFGGAFYAIHAVVACLDLPRISVSPAKWKNYFGLKGKGKGGGIDDTSRQIVLKRFPATQSFLTRKGDQHRAEAFLMAVWYAETGGRSTPAARNKKPVDVAEIMFDEEEIPE